MHLSSIEYNAIMMAINTAKNEIAQNTFIDPDNYTNEQLLEALQNVENKIINDNTPI